MSHTFPNIEQSFKALPHTLFLPGWGFDGRVLRLLQPAPAWLCPENLLEPENFVADLSGFLAAANISSVRIIGWSMGAMLALDFAARHPEKVASLILVSLRARWPDREIKKLQKNFNEAPEAFLKNFYRKCFLGDKQSYANFTRNLEPLYLNEAINNIDRLQAGLEYLARFENPHSVPGIPIRLIHGKQDIIAPVTEMTQLKGAEIEVVENTGHAVFLAASCSLHNEIRKQAIQKKFSRAAGSYDSFAKVQSEVAQKLAAKIVLPENTAEITRVLEIGCGTGNFTAMLLKKFPAAKITALDFSPEMIEKARQKLEKENVEFVCAEGEEYLEKAEEKSFDLVASNGSLQWFSDHDRSLKNIARILMPGGTFLCSIFGPDSLKKLGIGLKTLFNYPGNVAAKTFPAVNTLQQSLDRHFAHGAIEQELIEKKYISVHDLLVHIKKTGTGGWHEHGAPALTPARLKLLDQWFVETYGSCKVAYQVYLLQATK